MFRTSKAYVRTFYSVDGVTKLHVLQWVVVREQTNVMTIFSLKTVMCQPLSQADFYGWFIGFVHELQPLKLIIHDFSIPENLVLTKSHDWLDNIIYPTNTLKQFKKIEQCSYLYEKENKA